MTWVAIILVVISAFMHAGWNLVSKRQQPSAGFFLVASLSGALLLSPVLIVCHDTLLNGVPVRVWALLVGTGFFMALYYASLAGAYRAGDISVAYPLARSSPVIVVTVVALLLGRGDQVSGLCIAGIGLVVGGCFLVPVQRFNDLRLKNYLNKTCGLALIAAVGTSGYSILDDEALRVLRADPQVTLGTPGSAILYGCLEAWMASLWLAVFVAAGRTRRKEFFETLRARARPAVLTGVAIHLTYLLVLISLAFVNNVSYVVGFRQLSIPLGAMAGILILKEQPHVPKLVGVAIMVVGLTLLALG